MQTISNKIDEFEKHVYGRQLRIAQVLSSHFQVDSPGDPLSESAFAILNLCLSYFEMFEQFSTSRPSNGQSELFFERGFEKVFPNHKFPTGEITRIYRTLRCGMYHIAMPKGRCRLTREIPDPFLIDNGVLLINPARFVDSVIDHFVQYCAVLRAGCDYQLQSNFEEMWDKIAQQCQAAGNVGETKKLTTPEPTYYRP
ncbi:MAG: hypothetical protein WD065_21800 [Planctomycetaceae bacterium]